MCVHANQGEKKASSQGGISICTGPESGPTLSKQCWAEGLLLCSSCSCLAFYYLVRTGDSIVACHQLCAQKQMRASRMYLQLPSPPTLTTGPSLLSLSAAQPDFRYIFSLFSDRAWVPKSSEPEEEWGEMKKTPLFPRMGVRRTSS